MSEVVVYNLGGQQVLHRVSIKRAATMLYRGVARLVEAVEGQTFGPYPRPKALELVRYVFTHWAYRNRTGQVVYSKAGVLRRDRYRCAYCTKPGHTIDHIVPRSDGGPSTWLNTVAACADCNWKKKDRTPQEAGMRLRITPYVPTADDLNPRSARKAKKMRAVLALADSQVAAAAAA